MEDAIAKCVKIIESSASTENERLQIADAVLKRLAKNTHLSKLKEISEMLACMHIGLVWNGETMHGCDATDKAGRKVELKTAMIRGLEGKEGVNFNYAVKKTRAETLQHYSGDQFKGGHYWVGMNADKTAVLWFVWISQTRFLEILLSCKTLSKPLNFGSTLCKVCKRCRRVDELAGLGKCKH